MRSSDPLYPIKNLIGEHGFSSKEELASFCLSVGIFHDRRTKKHTRSPRSWDPSVYKTWPMLQIIAYNMNPSIKNHSEIKDFLYQYYLGGVEMITRKVSEKPILSALKDLSEFIPP